jgi:hypothetical protein
MHPDTASAQVGTSLTCTRTATGNGMRQNDFKSGLRENGLCRRIADDNSDSVTPNAMATRLASYDVLGRLTHTVRNDSVAEA